MNIAMKLRNYLKIIYIRKKKRILRKITDLSPAASDDTAAARVRVGLCATSAIVVRCAAS